MYRIEKVLNHNTVIAIETDKSEEFLVVSKGVGFGRKVAEFIEIAEDAKVYSLSEMTERGNAKELVKQFLTNQGENASNTHQGIDFLTFIVVPEDLDAEILVDFAGAKN
jgi:hypothetical protein